MQHEIKWDKDVNDEDHESLDKAISETLRSDHSPLNACHQGPVQIALSYSDPLNASVVGKIACSCGAHIGSVRGASDGSKMTLTAIEH